MTGMYGRVALHPCAGDHAWRMRTEHGERGVLVCHKCGETTAPPPLPALGETSPRPPEAPPLAGGWLTPAPAVKPAATWAANQLNQDQLRMLRLAGSWGLLASLGGKKFELRGEFSLHKPDLVVLVNAAGGYVDAVDADVLVASDDLLKEGWFSSIDQEKFIWSEQDLVLSMLQHPAALLEQGAAPF